MHMLEALELGLSRAWAKALGSDPISSCGSVFTCSLVVLQLGGLYSVVSPAGSLVAIALE